MRRIFFNLLIAFIIASLTATGVTTYWLNKHFSTPSHLKSYVTIDIPPGSSLALISHRLSKLGVIDDALAFELNVRLRQKSHLLKAGEYLFKAHARAYEVLEQLFSGHNLKHKFTAIEGLINFEILVSLRKIQNLKGGALGNTEEGELLPETYIYTRGEQRKTIIKRMRSDMKNSLQQLWQIRAAKLPLNSPQEALILASIVEKETSISEERPRVAAVFLNRLKRGGIRLQSDPCVTYGLHRLYNQPMNQALTHDDLKKPSDYNTYLNNDLPPTPICNPGYASIKAVLQPAQTKDIYFVADGSGGHVFAETLKQHQKNHKKWRKIRKEVKKIRHHR
jgi:UPF0755 protein